MPGVSSPFPAHFPKSWNRTCPNCQFEHIRKPQVLKSDKIKETSLEISAVADPGTAGFPRMGQPQRGGGRQPIILAIFPENCMKFLKNWTGGRAS